jgi:hypothetical protein
MKPRPVLLGLASIAALQMMVAGCARQQKLEIAEDSPARAAQAIANSRQVESLDDGTIDLEANSETFHFPDDRGGKLLADELSPSDTNVKQLTAEGSRQVRLPTPESLERINLQLPPVRAALPRSAVETAPPVTRKTALPGELPLYADRAAPALPGHRELPAGERVRVPSPLLSEPIPLRYLAEKVKESPAADAEVSDLSLSAALAPPRLRRGNPAPFLRLTIPDPFEYRSAARLLRDWPESSAPVTTAPQPVGR